MRPCLVETKLQHRTMHTPPQRSAQTMTQVWLWCNFFSGLLSLPPSLGNSLLLREPIPGTGLVSLLSLFCLTECCVVLPAVPKHPALISFFVGRGLLRVLFIVPFFIVRFVG